ncbi:MAG: class II aldolase/adducin family protein, partial [Caulobacteraceae bacterium]
MKSLWDEADARSAVDRYAAAGVAEALALRTYSARLLGADRRLVLHGGGNTSVKTTSVDLFGRPLDAIHVKGSGRDLATIEPEGQPAVRLAPLLELRALDSLSDEAMVNAQRQNLLDTAAPNPSLETLLHAFIPETFIDHTHAIAVLALADQPDPAAVIEAVYGARVACVPYVMPGFDLAKRAAVACESCPDLEGLILVGHGAVSFGANARDSYERMIVLVTAAERHIARRPAIPRPAPVAAAPAHDVLPRLRGAIGHAAGTRWPDRWVFDLRDCETARALVDDPRLADWAARGVATPDHVIRTKREPLVLGAPAGDLAAWTGEARRAVGDFVLAYERYFQRNAAGVAARTQLDPLPRVAAIPGLGLAGIGRSAAEAAIAADIAVSWAETLL